MVRKDPTIVTMILGRSTPDLGLGSSVELHGRHPGGLLNLLGVGEALVGQRMAAQGLPPALLQVESARSRGNEDGMDARMVLQAGTGLETGGTTEIVGDDENVACGIVGLNIGQQSNVTPGVA